MKAIALVFICVAVCLSCTKINTISMAEAKVSKPFTAVVEDVHMHGVRGADSSGYLAVEITLREESGTLLVIKEPRLNLTQLAFAASLIKGRSYEFPAAITNFESDLKRKRLERQSGGKLNSPGGI
jgi:hypothetical protein